MNFDSLFSYFLVKQQNVPLKKKRFINLLFLLNFEGNKFRIVKKLILYYNYLSLLHL